MYVCDARAAALGQTVGLEKGWTVTDQASIFVGGGGEGYGQPQGLLLKFGMGLGLLATLLIVFDIGPSEPLWLVLGLVFSVGNLAYALLQGDFNAALAGRVNTALNLAVFVGAFLMQWGFGAAVDVLQAAGHAPRDAYQITFGGLLALQFVSWLWFLRGR